MTNWKVPDTTASACLATAGLGTTMNATHGAGPGRRHDPVDHRLLLRARRVDKRFSNRRSMVRRVIGTMPAVEAVSPNYTDARQNLKSLMDAAVERSGDGDHYPDEGRARDHDAAANASGWPSPSATP